MRALAIVVAVAAMGSSDASRFAGAYIPGGAIKTARLASGAIAAVAERASAFDPSWASSLLVASGGGAPVELCDRVFHASRPLPLPSGELVVERGVAGAVVPGRVRVDELTLDAIDPRTRAVRRLYATTGFEAHLAALAGDEIIVYLVQPGVASLRAIDWRSGRERVVVPSLPPWAHDFAADGGALVVHDRDAQHPERETTERIDLANGNMTRLETK
ncbi:MAG TPA: hypothetical protein VF334_09745 [Polyangia bacterium]